MRAIPATRRPQRAGKSASYAEALAGEVTDVFKCSRHRGRVGASDTGAFFCVNNVGPVLRNCLGNHQLEVGKQPTT